MKLLLTSCGMSNKTIESELKKLLNAQNFKNIKLLYCTTASNFDGGAMNDWLIEDLIKLKELGFEIDVCDINGIDKNRFIKRFEWAKVLFFQGGNTQWLRKCIKETGLEEDLSKLLKDKVWVGASAGSCVAGPTIVNSCQDLFDENLDYFPTDGLNLVNFQIIPHLNNENFPKIKYENIENASKKLKKGDGSKVYIIDDQSAIVVNGDSISIASEGTWYKILI